MRRRGWVDDRVADHAQAGPGCEPLVLVRHGETVWHAEHRFAGTTDVALTPHSREQAEALGRWARTAGLAAVWASPLSRARETAAAAAGATGLAVHVDERLRELHFGRAEGRTKAELGAQMPAAVAAFLDDPVANHMPDGEEPAAAADRAVTCLRELAGAHPQGRCSSSGTRRCSGWRWPAAGAAVGRVPAGVPARPQRRHRGSPRRRRHRSAAVQPASGGSMSTRACDGAVPGRTTP